VGEFRHRDVLRPNNPLMSAKPSAGGPYEVGEGQSVQLEGNVPEATVPWFVELYDDNTYNDRSIVVDYQDRLSLELNNFNNLDGFNDKTSSVRWRLPIGVTAYLREHDGYSGDAYPLTGTGSLQFIADLDNVGFGDKTSSLQFVGEPIDDTPTISWDLDKDGIFGESGAGATRGDETLNAPIFVANGLDGPDEATAIMRVTPTAGAPKEYYGDIVILNIAPGVALTAVLTSGPGLGGDVDLTVEIEEPGDLDKTSLSIDWDDGSPLQVVDLGTNRITTVQHTYVADTPIEPVISVTADDGHDETTRTIQVTIGPELIHIDGFEN
jgi:hypothetical protein